MQKELTTIPTSSTKPTALHSKDVEVVQVEVVKDAFSSTYWRSIDQLTETPEYVDFLHREFPQGASELNDPVTRRNFMKIMGASVALAGMASCRMPKENIVPFVKSPENVIPGKPKFYASTFAFADHSYGLLVESHDGRPTKIEGNDMHPASQGATHPWALASVLSLYDPDRSKEPLFKKAPSSWNQFEQDWRTWSQNAPSGKGMAILSQSISSPSEEKLANEFKAKYPNAVWATYEPVSQENAAEGVFKVTGKKARPTYNLDQANIVVAIDSDFLNTEPNSVRYTKDFSKRRRVFKAQDSMNRLYSIESMHTSTGAMADHRLPVSSSRIQNFLVSLYMSLQEQGVSLFGPSETLRKVSLGEEHKAWIKALAKDLKQNMGKSALIVGSHQSPFVHALALNINYGLGNLGKTVVLNPINEYSSSTASVKTLVDQISKKQISTLVILGGNPVYNLPNDFGFAKLLSNVQHTVHASSYVDETSSLCEWHLPLSHYLESWSDAKTMDGAISIVQPLIRPLFDSRSLIEIFSVLTLQAYRPGYDTLTENWKGKNWDQTLHDGVLKNSTENEIRATSFNFDSFAVTDTSAEQMEVTFVASPSTFDGRFANNGWLQELPQPITKVTWDNPALISPALAKQLGLVNGQWISIKKDNRSFEIPVWIVPGQAKSSITLHLGYGQAQGTVAKDKGFNTYMLRTSMNHGFESGFTIGVLSKIDKIASTQDHGSMEGRPIVREATKEHFEEHPDFVNHVIEHPPLKSLWKEPEYTEGYQWGMVIDLNTCTGCNACVTSCQSENNIPIVGKEQVLHGREMHWIRIDRYFSGPEDEPLVVYQPMACQHCENAPCEQVCPVNATVHDKEGLNTMVYNRCIGTRYCSNNCPYKVRRFNFFNYTKEAPAVTQMANNPDVTVRFRGVMEKCTYCLQRINGARHNAKLEERSIQDGEIRTACQQACPADAIIFGNVNDPNSRVSQLKKYDQKNYAVLEELNIKPRTTYLAKLRNPNPELKGEA